MLFGWLAICLMIILWLCAFVTLAACAPILLSARRERWFRRVRRTFWNACETLWWAGPRPTRITIEHADRAPRASHSERMTRRRAA